MPIHFLAVEKSPCPYIGGILVVQSVPMPISLGYIRTCANLACFRGLMPVLPHLCPLCVPEVGVCGYRGGGDFRDGNISLWANSYFKCVRNFPLNFQAAVRNKPGAKFSNDA